MKLDLLVVLCAGNFTNSKDYDDYITLNKKTVYIGAKNRMKASVLIDNCTKEYLVVGGSKEKVLAMKDYLVKNNCKSKITCLVSGPSTNGNIIALNKYIEQNITELSNVGILSNGYHFTRIFTFLYKAMSKYSQEHCNFIPIVSEIILDNNVESKPMENMIMFESNGIIDLKEHRYKQKKTQYKVL